MKYEHSVLFTPLKSFVRELNFGEINLTIFEGCALTFPSVDALRVCKHLNSSYGGGFVVVEKAKPEIEAKEPPKNVQGGFHSVNDAYNSYHLNCRNAQATPLSFNEWNKTRPFGPV